MWAVQLALDPSSYTSGPAQLPTHPLAESDAGFELRPNYGAELHAHERRSSANARTIGSHCSLIDVHVGSASASMSFLGGGRHSSVGNDVTS